MMTIVAGPIVDPRVLVGRAALTPRVTIRRMWTPSLMPLASRQSKIRPASSALGAARCRSEASWRRPRAGRGARSRKAMPPSMSRRPSQTPSPSTKPESNTETTALSRGTSSPLTEIRIASLRGSSVACWVPVVCSRVHLHSPEASRLVPFAARQDLFAARNVPPPSCLRHYDSVYPRGSHRAAGGMPRPDRSRVRGR